MTPTGSVPQVPLPQPTTGAVPSVPYRHPSAPSVAPAPDARAVDAPAAPFTWHGSPWDIAGTCVLNAMLTVLTLGIYGFWGRTEIRRRMWSSVRLFGEPLAYHGTPQELMRGFFAVLLAVLAPLFVMSVFVVVFFGQASAVFALYQVGLFAVLYPVLAAIAYYRARRYRLARTSWRGIRGSLTGSSATYGAMSWLTMAAYPVTLGWIAPYRAVTLQRYIVNDTTLGNRPLTFSGASKPLYGRYAVLWFGSIVLYFVTFGIIGAMIGGTFDPANAEWWRFLRGRDWAIIAAAILGAIILWSLMSSFYYARLYNHLAHSTLIAPADPLQDPDHPDTTRFDLKVSGGPIIWLFISNALITYLSLYVLKPVATARSMKFYTERLRIVGPFDPALITQNTVALDTTGEGLAQAFDLDAF